MDYTISREHLHRHDMTTVGTHIRNDNDEEVKNCMY